MGNSQKHSHKKSCLLSERITFEATPSFVLIINGYPALDILKCNGDVYYILTIYEICNGIVDLKNGKFKSGVFEVAFGIVGALFSGPSIQKGIEGLTLSDGKNVSGKSGGSSDSSGASKDEYSDVFDELLNRSMYKDYEVDCSEIAEDFYNAAGGKGHILHIEPNVEGPNLNVYSSVDKFYYHEVFTYDNMIYDI